MLRRIVSPGFAAISFTTVAYCNEKENWPFDTKGLPTHYKPVGPQFKDGPPLLLSGVGMRRKNLYIVEVDVYQIGLSISDRILKKSKSDGINNLVLSNDSPSTISDFVINSNSKDKNVCKASISLKFVRTVSQKQILDAFHESFIGCDPIHIAKFNEVIGAVMGTEMKSGQEVIFHWMEGGGLVFMKDGVVVENSCFSNPEIERRLLEVYVDPRRAVSPELITSIQSNIAEIINRS